MCYKAHPCTTTTIKNQINWKSSKYRSKVKIKDSTLKTIQRGLRKAVTNGTAVSLNDPTLPQIAAKTGTAEDSSGGEDHAWLGCYAPYPEGEIVIISFAQNTPGGGSVHALPMAKKVLSIWEQIRNK